jgi:archaeal flagellar protein FlaI
MGSWCSMQISGFLNSLKKHQSENGEQGPADPPAEPEKTVAGGDEKKTPAPKPKKPDAGLFHYFHLLKGIKSPVIEEYDFERDGTLVEANVDDTYEQIDQYWIENGCSLIIIALNKKTNQQEYLLFEPSLSDFEYELLERLYEDLRCVLILSSKDIKKDRKHILLEKMNELFDDYGVTLTPSARHKIQYFLIRNFLGWSRIDPLMKDPNLEDISCDGNKIPIFLYHRHYRNIKTNIAFESDVLNSLAITLTQRSGNHISMGSPMIDATLPDGSS